MLNKIFNRIYILGCLIVLQSFLCCSPKSYCFLSLKDGNVIIKDTSRIRSITVTKTTPENRAIREVMQYEVFDVPINQYKIPLDSNIKKCYIEISVTTTDFRDRYFLGIYPSDWQKKTTMKFKAQIR